MESRARTREGEKVEIPLDPIQAPQHRQRLEWMRRAYLLISSSQRRALFDRLTGVLGPGNHRWIAKRSKRDNGHISRILSGRSPRPSATTLQAIAQAAHISIEDVYWFVGIMQRVRADMDMQEQEGKAA